MLLQIVLAGTLALLFALAALVGNPGRVGARQNQPTRIAAVHSGRFHEVGPVVGRGSILNAVVAAGPTPGSKRIYASFGYAYSRFEVVIINPHTGATVVETSPLNSEESASAMATGSDGNVYLGTGPSAHLMRLTTRDGKLADLGPTIPSAQYIWQLTRDRNGDIYGCTFPNAKLFRFSPRSRKVVDLGRVAPGEQYARSCISGGDGYIYVGVGNQKSDLVAYDTASGVYRSLLPPDARVPGIGDVFRGSDGRIYGLSPDGREYLLHAGEARAIPSAPKEYVQPLRGGSGIRVSRNGEHILTCAVSGAPCSPLVFRYRGKGLAISRLARGLGRRVYASTYRSYGSLVLPAWLLRVRGPHGVEKLGRIGTHVYSMLSYRRRLLFAGSPGAAPFESYDPSRPFSESPPQNPRPIVVPSSDTWRPVTMTRGPAAEIYIGSIAPYGKLTGSITAWNRKLQTVHQYEPITNQSIVSLAPIGRGRQASGPLLLGSTAISAQGTGFPTERSAKIFLWDTRTRRTIWQRAPLAEANQITNVVVTPRGTAYAFAIGKAFTKLLRVDLRTHEITTSGTACSSPLMESSVEARGSIWTLLPNGICRIDIKSGRSTIVAPTPGTVTAGIALVGHQIYFGSYGSIWKYSLPRR